MDLNGVYIDMAKVALMDGVAEAEVEPDGELAAWVRRNVTYSPGAEFFIVFGVACAVADLRGCGPTPSYRLRRHTGSATT